MLGAKRKNLLREKAIQRDLENGVIKKSYDSNLLILKSSLEKVYEIVPNLPYVDIEIDNDTNNRNAKSLLEGDRYLISIGQGLINSFRETLKKFFFKGSKLYNKIYFQKYLYNENRLIECLFEYGLEYIVLHEFAHIRDGHLAFFNANKDYENDIDLKRTLEYHADHSAVCMLLGEGIVNNTHPINNIDEEIPLYILAAYIQIYIVKNINFIWSIDDIVIFDKLKDSHPIYGLRQYALFNSFISKMEMHSSNISCMVNNTLGMIKEFEEYKQNTRNIEFNKIPFMIALTKEGHYKLKEIHSNWKKYRDDINKYAYMNPGDFSEWVDTASKYFIKESDSL